MYCGYEVCDICGMNYGISSALRGPDARRNARWAPTGRSAPTSATVRTAPNATTSTGRVCATRASRAPAARTASAPAASTDSAATSTAPAGWRTRSGDSSGRQQVEALLSRPSRYAAVWKVVRSRLCWLDDKKKLKELCVIFSFTRLQEKQMLLIPCCKKLSTSDKI